MERPFYEADEDRTSLVPSLQQDAPWVHVSDACAGFGGQFLADFGLGKQCIANVESGSTLATGFRHGLDGTIHGKASTPYGTWAYPCPNAYGPGNSYHVDHGYYVMDSSTMSLGYSDVHNTPSNQGQDPHLTTNPYLAGTIDGFTDLHDYRDTNAAYGAANTAYGDANAAYAADTNTGDLFKGIWPSTDPVSTLMGYNHGAADINPGVYPLAPNPTLAPGNLTTTPIQAGYEPAVANTDDSRPQCSTCNTTFKRTSDLARHEKKHQARRAFKCSVPGCSFKGSYRKDKLDAHVKSCHTREAA